MLCVTLALAALVLAVNGLWTAAGSVLDNAPALSGPPTAADVDEIAQQLEDLTVAAADPMTGYDRAELFGQDWAPVGQCDTRAVVLARDLTDVVYSARTPCTVVSGTLLDPYTGATVAYQPGAGWVEIEHVVALANAWTTGAQSWDAATRLRFANDTSNLLAVSAAANQDKGAADAAGWRPAPAFWCSYASIQISVKTTYQLWVTPQEKAALTDLLSSC